MMLGQALKGMESGRGYRRPSWEAGRFAKLRSGDGVMRVIFVSLGREMLYADPNGHRQSLTDEDIMADDWEEIECSPS